MTFKEKAITVVAGLAIVLAAGLDRADGEQWGRLKGRFVFDGPIPKPKAVAGVPANCGNAVVEEDLVVDPKGGLANVIVFVRGNVGVHPDFEKSKTDTVVLETKECRFEPHVLGMRVGQTLVFKNSDVIAHNPNLEGRRIHVNPLIPAGETFKTAFDEPEFSPLLVSCNIHPWMRARLLVRPNPYFAISKSDGSFEINKLPAGDLEFVVYHERAGFVQKADLNGRKVEWSNRWTTFSVKAGDKPTDLGVIKLSSKLFKQ